MINAPKTVAEAKQYRYGQWAGNERGWPYTTYHCAYEVISGSRRDGHVGSQCLRFPDHGPSGLYCKQHAKKLPKPSLVIENDPPLELTEYEYGAPQDLGDQ